MSEHLQFLVDNMAQGVFSQLADGSLVDVNPAALEMFGLDREQFCGRTSAHPDWKVVREDGTPLAPQQHPSMVALGTGRPVKDTVVGVFNPHRQGFVWLIVNAMPVIDAGEERPCRVFVTLQDITERKQAEADLRKSELLFRAFFELNPIATIITSPSGTIHMINSAFAEGSGFSGEEVVGRTAQEVGFWRDPAARDQMVAAIREHGVCNSFETILFNKGGQPRTCLVSSRAVEHQNELRILSTVVDVTTQRAAEKALRQLDQAKSDFVATAAHELRTPLVAILGYAELLERQDQHRFSDQQRQAYAAIIRRNSELLSRLVNELLDVERIQRQRPLSLAPRKTSLAKLIEAAIASTTPKGPEHRFILTHANPLPQTLWIDPDRISQVLHNLLDNAVKYSPGGGTVEVATTTGERCVEIAIRDWGIGMTSEEVEQIFQRFYRAKTMNAETQGLGLGMFIVKQIVEEHGGEIFVSSSQGEGTTITFTLPLETPVRKETRGSETNTRLRPSENTTIPN